jgi:hypothetical protein
VTKIVTASAPNGYLTEADLEILGPHDWTLVAVVSRPGMPERAFFQRILKPDAPKIIGKKR